MRNGSDIQSFAGFMSMLFNTKETEKKEPSIENQESNAKFIKSPNRPVTFREYTNKSNEQAVKILKDAITASKLIKHRRLQHILLFGPAGTGKTTLAKICAYEYEQADFIETIGSTFKTKNDVLRLMLKVFLNQLEGLKTIVFIDEIHELGKAKLSDTIWYTILEDFVLYHTLEGNIVDGVLLEDNKLMLEPFTVIGATTDVALMKKPLRDRFKIHCTLKPYSNEDIYKVVKLTAKKKDYAITPKATSEIANRARGNPRVSVNFLESAENKRIVKKCKAIDKNIVKQMFSDLQIEHNGLTESDISILKELQRNVKGLGLKTLAGIVEIDERTLKEIYLGYLGRMGFVVVAHKHFITAKGLQYIEQFGD